VAVVAVQAEGGEGDEVAARTDAHLQPAATQQVDDDGILGDPDRELERQRHDAGAEANAGGVGCGMRQEHERCRQAAFPFVEMMLGDPGRIEATLLGLNDLFRSKAIAPGSAGLVEQAGEEAEALDRRSGRHLRHAARSAGRAIQPPSRAGAALSSWRSTFFTISVSLVWVGAGTPM